MAVTGAIDLLLAGYSRIRSPLKNPLMRGFLSGGWVKVGK
jgi:hypothetical protein